MLKSKTVFVVGAGASFEANLPTGEQLKQQVAALVDIRVGHRGQTSGDADIWQAILRSCNGGDTSDYKKHCRQIAENLPTAASIDNYVHAFKGDEKFELVAKLGIAKAILEAEAGSLFSGHPGDPWNFKQSSCEKSWYTQFFRLMCEGITRDDVDNIFYNLRIVCFNYDRCIEVFLSKTLERFFKIDPKKARDLVAQVDIVHPYGTVGKEWDRGSSMFGSERPDILEAANSIRTFTQGIQYQSTSMKIKEYIKEAESVVFMGFAFHNINMELLHSKEAMSCRRVFGTTLGMSNADQTVIGNELSRRFGWPNGGLALYLNGDTCANYLKDYFRTIMANPDQ